MTLRKRIAFVYRQYLGLIPAIYRAWRSSPYPPPTPEEVAQFVKEFKEVTTHDPLVCRRAPEWPNYKRDFHTINNTTNVVRVK